MFNGVFGIINFVLTKAIYDLTEVNNMGGYNNFECKNIDMLSSRILTTTILTLMLTTVKVMSKKNNYLLQNDPA